MNSHKNDNQYTRDNQGTVPAEMSRSIDWYAEGEERIVAAGEIQIAVRFVSRKGRKGRIAISAPAGATFKALDRSENFRPPSRSI